MTELPTALFEQAVRSQRDGVCITDGNLDPPGPTILFVNAAFERITGYAASEVIGRSPRLLQGPLTDPAVLARLRADLTSGQAFEGRAVNYRASGDPFVMSWSAEPIHDGDARYFVAVHRDVTRTVQLDLLRVANRRVADAGLEAQLGDRPLRLAARRIAAAAQDLIGFGRATVVLRLRRDWLIDPEVVGDRRGVIAPVLRETGPTVLESGERITLVAPFPRSDVTGGVVCEGLSTDQARLTSLEDLGHFSARAASTFASLAAMAQRNRETLAVQRVLRPADQLDIEGFATAVRYIPSHHTERAGGDWYDVIELEDRLRLVMGDVIGKGLRAAAEMGLIRSHLNALLASGSTPAAVLADAHEFCRMEELMATVLLVDVESSTGRIIGGSAGHLPPMLVSPHETELIALEPAPPLGAFDSREDAPSEFVSHLGDRTLLMYTDGVIHDREWKTGDGLEWLRRIVASGPPEPAQLVQRLLEASGEARDDDLALLAVAALA